MACYLSERADLPWKNLTVVRADINKYLLLKQSLLLIVNLFTFVY